MTDSKDNIRKQLDMRSYATRIWLVFMVTGFSLGSIKFIFNLDSILIIIGIVFVSSALVIAILEKRIDRYFQNRRRTML